jgi:hypothetical protein
MIDSRFGAHLEGAERQQERAVRSNSAQTFSYFIQYLTEVTAGRWCRVPAR